MKIAVTYLNGEVFQHFGHSEQFKIYEVEGDKVVSSEVIDAGGSGHSALAGLLSSNNVNILICGGIGAGAQMALVNEGIKLYGGVKGDADAAVEALLKNSLSYDPDAKCDHHDHIHEGGHSCSEHNCSSSCGNHKCH